MNISISTVTSVQGNIWLIFNESLEVANGVQYIHIKGFTQEIEKGTEVHKRKDMWIRVLDGVVTNLINGTNANSSEECLFICRYECNAGEKQPCLATCKNTYTQLCRGNSSMYCYPYCDNKTKEDCNVPCLSDAQQDCEVICSAGSPPPAQYETCMDGCIDREHNDCISDCANDAEAGCRDVCASDFIDDCIDVVYPACIPKCEGNSEYVSCLSGCDTDCT